MTIAEQVQQALEETPVRITANLKGLKAVNLKTDSAIAEEMGVPQHWVQERMSGKRRCDAAAVQAFALCFRVPVGLLYERPDGLLQALADLDYSPSA